MYHSLEQLVLHHYSLHLLIHTTQLLLVAFIILLVVLLLFGYWKYYYTYSDGYRSGLLQKLSHKGNIFKTYEGELVQRSIVSTGNVGIASEKFYFSVASDSVAKSMQNFEGKNVKLHYLQKNGTLPWRGESEYIVDKVEIDNNP